MQSGFGRPFEIVKKETRTRRLQLYQEVNGVKVPFPLTDYSGKYVAFKNLEDGPEKALLNIDVTIEDEANGIISILYDGTKQGPDGTDQDAFEGYEEITLFDPADKRISLKLRQWAGEPYGKFNLLNTRVA